MGPLSLVVWLRSLYRKFDEDRQVFMRSTMSWGDSLVRAERVVSRLRSSSMCLRASRMGTDGKRALAS